MLCLLQKKQRRRSIRLVFRHEWKHEISTTDVFVLRQRLRAVMRPDGHAVNGCYHISSLYFDTPTDLALRENLSGANFREKFRIRYYNGDSSVIFLEKKRKQNGVGTKDSVRVTAQEVTQLLAQDLEWMRDPNRPLLQELRSRMTTQGLAPKVIVNYTREPFVFAPGNVRVTIDYDIRLGMRCEDFLKPDCLTIPARDNPILLEVKWDEFLPSIIRDAVQLEGRRTEAFSKYVACRVYG